MKAPLKGVILLPVAVCLAQVDNNDRELLAKVRTTAESALKSLPNYICLESTSRLHAPKLTSIANAKPVDGVEMEVAHIGDKEMYSLPGRNMFAATQINEVVDSGLVGTGAYSSHLIDVLYGRGAQFRFAGKETLGGRAAFRWNFTLARDASNWTIGSQKRSARVGSEGSLWVDAVTLSIMRLACRAVSLPARFPIKTASRTIDYAIVRIGGRDVLLPSAAEDTVEHSGGVNINRSRFGNYREFSTSSTITFAEADAPSPSQPVAGQAAAGLSALPNGLRIPLALDSRLRSDSVVIGAAVRAHVRSDVRNGGVVLIPKGTAVHGLVREFLKDKSGFSSSLFTLTVEFKEITLPTGTIPFCAFLKSMDAPITGLYWLIPAEKGTMRLAYFGLGGNDDSGDRIKRPAQPGYAVLLFRDQHAFDLVPGTPMTWTTLESESGPN